MIAGSLLLGRALAPIDMLVGTWKGFSLATAQYNRLKDLLEKIPLQLDKMSLPAPSGSSGRRTDDRSSPRLKKPCCTWSVFRATSWAKCSALLGQARRANQRSREHLLGIWPTYAGKVRLDGADISVIGIELSWGPILDTCLKISNCLTEPSLKILQGFREIPSDDVVAAAQLAGVHELDPEIPPRV